MKETTRREAEAEFAKVATGSLFYFYCLSEKMQKPEQRKYQLLQTPIMAHWVYWSVKSVNLQLGTPNVHTAEQAMQMQLMVCPQWIINPLRFSYKGILKEEKDENI